MKRVLSFVSLVALGVSVAVADTVDPRTRTFVWPTRVVWQAPDEGAYGSRRATVAPEKLVGEKYGQVPELGTWRILGCVLKNFGERPGFILDFGREIHGGVEIGFSFCSHRGQRLRLRFGESVGETMVDVGEKGATNDHAMRDLEFEAPACGSISIGDTGFRFVRLDLVSGGEVYIDYVRAISLMRPMERRGDFRCSDERLNRIFKTAVDTVHLCCQTRLWDGIKRDRLVWMGDMHPETMAILSVFGGASVLPESIDYMISVTSPETWMNKMTPYSFWFVRNVRDWYHYTGDIGYLRRHKDYLKATFAAFEKLVGEDGRLSGLNRPFLDWPSNHNPEAVDAGMQGLILMAYEDLMDIARLVGDEDWFASCQATLRKLRSVEVDPHGSKQAAAILALSGLKNAKEMCRDVIARGGTKDFSTFYGYYMLEAMSAAGRTAEAIGLVRDFWGGMLDMGATSFWEDFNLAWTNNATRVDELPVAGKKDIHGDFGEFCYPGYRHSLCHGWSSGPAAWLIRHVLGIEILEPGARVVRVQPELGFLDWAEGALAVPGGAVKVRAVRRKDGSCETTVSAPDGVRVVRDETDAIQAEIDRVAAAGGGEVRISAGRHEIKSLTLRSNTTLRLLENAILSSSRKASDFKILSEKGPARLNPAILQMYGATNVTIVGEKGSAIEGNDAYDPYGEETYRGPHGILAEHARRVTVRGLEMRNIGNWATRFLDSADLVFEDLVFRGGHDGVHVRGCDRVRVSRCSIHTGDDCIAGFGNDDVLVEDCELNTACSAFRFSGRHVRINRCRAFGPAEFPIRNSTSIPKRVLGEDVKAEGRHTMHSFFTYHSELTAHARFDPCDIVVTDCEVRGTERFFHYNMSGNEIWQKGRPLLEITFRRVKGEKIGMSLCSYGKEAQPIRLTIEDADFSFAEPQRELIRGAFIRELNLKDVRVRDVDGPVLRSWGGETELKVRDVKGVRPVLERETTKFYTHHV